MVLSFLFVGGVVAVVFGLVARSQARRPASGRTRGMATAGAVLGALSLVLGAVIVVGVVHVARTARSLTSLRTGDCFDSVHGLLPHYRLRSCAGPHEMEAVGVFSDASPDGTPWPGLTGFDVDRPRCGALTTSYVGGVPDPLRYRASTLVPSERQWSLGTRRVVCILEAPGGTSLVGTARGSARGGAGGPVA
jgi:hypothetical protein